MKGQRGWPRFVSGVVIVQCKYAAVILLHVLRSVHSAPSVLLAGVRRPSGQGRGWRPEYAWSMGPYD